jgi:hypothetical protein
LILTALLLFTMCSVLKGSSEAKQQIGLPRDINPSIRQSFSQCKSYHTALKSDGTP